MLDINNLNLQSNGENEKTLEFDPEKELEVLHESTIIDSKNNNTIIKQNDNNSLIEQHKRCVPLQIYKKVYEDKQKLISEVNNLTTEIKNINQNKKILSLEN
jgi:hypothetical protein